MASGVFSSTGNRAFYSSGYSSGDASKRKNYDDTSLLVLRTDTLLRITSKGELLDTLIITDGHILDFDTGNGKIGVLTSTMQY